MKINFTDTSIFNYSTAMRTVSSRKRMVNNMFYISSGQIVYLQQGRRYECGQGDIVWLPYQSDYEAIFVSEKPSEIAGICLDFQMADEEGNRIIPPPEIRVMAHDSDGLYKNLYHSAMEKQQSSRNDFAYEIFSRLFCGMNSVPGFDRAFTEIRDVIETMERRPQNNESVTEMASRCGISETSLRSKFKQYTGGLSPIEYRNQLRVEKAKELLQTGSGSMEVIADALGFYDASYFTKIFKRFTGQTPHEYRRKAQRSAESDREN